MGWLACTLSFILYLRSDIMEIWQPIKGYEERYSVSNKGRVASFMFRNKRRPYPKILSLTNNTKSAYVQVQLFNGTSSCKKELVHRLVAKHFIPNPFNLPEVNHINGDKRDNSVNNLEWVTSKDNVKHALSTGLRYNVDCSWLKKKFKAVSPDGVVFEGIGLNSFCKEHNLDSAALARTSTGKQRTHKGWTMTWQ
ncbi:HNH endonuclease [Proteus phage PM 85]|uniref:HNH DNAse n=1 Tax=Proteus phage PM 85 TaxID=1560283 RepID=A0A0F6NY96_9CAUD|nr:HNH endonuclease [Proteus phage PM 85]AIW03111.1 HNH DNAse [Proteus phage PM 85]